MTPRAGTAVQDEEWRGMHSHNEEAKFMANIKDGAPEMDSAFLGFDKAVFNKTSETLIWQAVS
jgi:hypothetical protein